MIDEPVSIYTKQPVTGIPAGAPVSGVPPVSSTTTTTTTANSPVSPYGAPVATTSTVSSTTTSLPPTPTPKKRNRMAIIGGLLAFLILAISGIYIAWTQYGGGLFAPNAPESEPAARVTKLNTCSLSFNVAPAVSPSPTPSVSPSATPSATPRVSPSATPSATPSPTPTPTPPTYACNSECVTDANCQTANADYVCSAAQNSTCRLNTNVTSTTCTPAAGTFACNSTCVTNADCATADANYVCATVGSEKRCRLTTNTTASNCSAATTTTIGCNDTCTTNSDCSNANHICYNNQCRLGTNPTNASCSGTVATTPGETQPALPATLPQTGPEDWGIWLKAGLGALGIGAILLLFL